MKKISVSWDEVTQYQAVIEVPDDYPETLEAYEDAENLDDPRVPISGSGESDWWEKVEAQVFDWPNTACMSIRERELQHIERVDE
jgi:hypothetical protein